MLLRIVAIVFPLFAIVFFGWLYGRKKQPDMAFANQLNMDVFVPALVFAAMADKSFDLAANWGLALGAVVGVAGSGLAGWGLARLLGVAPKTLVPPMMFNNCGNLGLPLTVLAFGDAALGPAVVLFMISNLAHFSFGAWLLDHHTRLSNLWRIPVVLASLAGLVVSLLHMPLWPPLKMAIRMLGDVSIPLLLFSLGVRLAGARLAAVKVGLWGAVARPLVGLLLAYGTALVLGLEGQQKALLVIFGALPPAVLNYVFAERYRQEPDQVASIVMIGNLAALVFLPLALALVLP
ncbi:transporter [Azospira sp. I13]|uniref:AEC family transporter n=1 Tax=Azospira sp. I13 TaxID=1765050 RepID=UPI000D4695F7|nr:AEC family transporter [Azospira sp. I13]GBG03415.1 transporter [Azospira sp. I13]